MKKVFILLALLFFMASQYTNTFASTWDQYYEQKILNEVKRNEKIVLSDEELKQAIDRTKDELLGLRSGEIADGYKTSHECYPNSVIKKISIYSANTVMYRYFDAYGKRIGDLEYSTKDNSLADAYPYPPLSPNKKNDKVSIEKIHSIGDMYVDYDGDKIYRIGNMYVDYNGDKIYRIGNMYVDYNGDKISRIGNMYVDYNGDKISRIGNMYVNYNGDKIHRIGDMYVKYERDAFQYPGNYTRILNKNRNYQKYQ